MTATEFLNSTNRLGPGKHILVDGVVPVMAVASPTHGQIQANLAALIGTHLKTRGKLAVMTEVAVQPHIHAKTNVHVPDLVVAWRPEAADRIAVTPWIIVEVSSGEAADHTPRSITACSTIPSVREMLVVDCTRQYAEYGRRNGNECWPGDPDIFTRGGAPTLDCIDLYLPLDDIYDGTHLAAN